MQLFVGDSLVMIGRNRGNMQKSMLYTECRRGKVERVHIVKEAAIIRQLLWALEAMPDYRYKHPEDAWVDYRRRLCKMLL